MLLCAISGASDFFHPPCRVYGRPPEPACPLLPDELASVQDPVHSPSTPERFHGRSEPFMLYRSFLPWSSSGRLAWRIIGPPQITADPRWYCGSSSVGEQGAWWSLSLFDRFLDEAERVGVLDQRPNFRTIQTGWNFGINLEFQGHLTAGKGRELLDDGLDDLMDIARRPL